MKIKNVVRLAKANNPALVHLSNVWAERTGESNPVVTIKMVCKSRMIQSWLTLAIFMGWLILSASAYYNVINLPIVQILGFLLAIGSLVFMVYLYYAYIDKWCDGHIIGNPDVTVERWLSAKRFMKAVTFLEENELDMTIDKWDSLRVGWDNTDPQTSLSRIASKDAVTITTLKKMVAEVTKLQSIAWRQKEAEVKKKEFEEFHKTMIGLLDIPSDYGYYFPPAPIPTQEGITIH